MVSAAIRSLIQDLEELPAMNFTNSGERKNADPKQYRPTCPQHFRNSMKEWTTHSRRFIGTEVKGCESDKDLEIRSDDELRRLWAVST
jgi:S-methylmethionine-dependent homocysteine/selenocysteine methylase